MRWAEPADAEELAEFNFGMHNDNPGNVPELWLKDWTRDFLSGRHPTTGPDDITVVVDDRAGGKIVSSAVLLNQEWSYDAIPFGCGRPELIATAEEYRRRGLIRAQFEMIHALSAAYGQMVQAIAGIPWYYRQFGYEMALNLSGGRLLQPAKIKELPAGQSEKYQLRLAEDRDLPFLDRLYTEAGKRCLIYGPRDEATWRYDLAVSGRAHDPRRGLMLVETLAGLPAGYIDLTDLPQPNLTELNVDAGYSLREVALFLARQIKWRHEQTRGEDPKFAGVTFNLGGQHPVYEALNEELDPLRPPYAWYIRVPDLARFLEHLRPVLERRLAAGPMAGYSGKLRLNFYTWQLELLFERGCFERVQAYKPDQYFDGDGFFPGQTFLQLLFGYRSLTELEHGFADCFTDRPEASVLLNSLFPKRHSYVSP